jgi:DNA-binding transcriptional LysR family regulator
VNIDYNNLRQLDLNLLIALDVLITEASVTRAAERLNMSQSAMSYSLKKLRIILNDDILIRTSREMEVTPYARQISDRFILQRFQTVVV